MISYRNLALVAGLGLLACKTAPATKPSESPPPAATEAAPATAGQPPSPRAGEAPSPVPAQTPAPGAVAGAAPVVAIDLSALDREVKPCQDFYKFACGNWMKKTELPSDRSRYTRSFDVLSEKNTLRMRQIAEDDAAGKPDPADPYAQKVGDFYASCMDESKAETSSLATLKKELKAVDAVRPGPAFVKLVAQLHARGTNAFFAYFSEQDSKDATQMIAGFDQAGIGLPDRDYYLDAKHKELLGQYRKHVANMFELAGESTAKAAADADTVVALETKLAEAQLDKVSRRDPYKTYHRLEREGLKKAAPKFGWDTYLAARGTPEVTAIDVAWPDFMTKADALIATTKPADLKAYLRWHVIESATPALGKAFVEERFHFSQALTGQKTLEERWKRCSRATEMALSQAIGRTFVQDALGEKGKQVASDLMDGIQQAFDQNLDGVAWMDDATKTASREKLHKMRNKVAYPEKWRDYDGLKISRASYLANRWASSAFESKYRLSKIGKPVDHKEWGMPPTVVNASYNPSMNDLTFYAGILQPPFFGPDATAAANAGGIGMVIGHELTHGFDDQGRQYDGDGNLRDWWTKKSGDEYTKRAECVAKQYDGFTVADGAKVNGHLTLGENIADIGGVKLAYAAFKKAHPEPVAQGDFSGDQLFFLAFAQDWCTKVTDKAQKLQVMVDPHSPSEWRVNGALQDTPAFAQAFGCQQGEPMAPKDRCEVW